MEQDMIIEEKKFIKIVRFKNKHDATNYKPDKNILKEFHLTAIVEESFVNKEYPYYRILQIKPMKTKLH